MAIFRLEHSIVKWKNGGSSLATAAYNSGENLGGPGVKRQRTDHSDKEGVLFKEIYGPPGTPLWAKDRFKLWHRLEARERTKRATLAYNFIINLPHELSLEQNISLIRDFIRNQFTAKGFLADYAVHAPDPRGDSRNIHFHMLTPLRKVRGESFGLKYFHSPFTLRKQIFAWRKAWADHVNKHLGRYGHKETVDARSRRARGLPTIKSHKHKARPKLDAELLRALRTAQAPLERAPLVRYRCHTNSSGGKVYSASIRHSIINNLRQMIPKPNWVPKRGNKSAWPEEAQRDWMTWGSRAQARFYVKWPDLAPVNYQALEGPKP